MLPVCRANIVLHFLLTGDQYGAFKQQNPFIILQSSDALFLQKEQLSLQYPSLQVSPLSVGPRLELETNATVCQWLTLFI